MNILLYKDFVLSYVRKDCQNPLYKNQIEKILSNENSIFLYSGKLIDFLKTNIDDTLPEYVRYTAFITKLQNEGKKVKSSLTSTSFEEEFLHIYQSHNSNVIITISLIENIKIVDVAIPKIAILSQQQKPNYHWLVVQLAICHPFTLSVDEDDFNQNGDVDKFFTNLFSIPKKITDVTIFDDYYNVENHNKYDYIHNRRDLLVYYCTESHYKWAKFPRTDYRDNYDDGKYEILKEEFPRLELRTKLRGSHTRRIVFEGFIVNPDNDLDMLDKNQGKLWSVHIRFSEEKYRSILEIRDTQYRRHNP